MSKVGGRKTEDCNLKRIKTIKLKTSDISFLTSNNKMAFNLNKLLNTFKHKYFHTFFGLQTFK